MATFQTFEEIEAWKRSRELVKEIYRVTSHGPFGKDFTLRNQIRRAGVSIVSNIAEGFERNGTNEFVQFLSVAKGSAGELKAQLYIALDQEYIDDKTFKQLADLSWEIGGLIGGLMDYLRRSSVKGTKYK